MKTQKDVWGITLTNTWDNADRMTVEKYSDASAQLRVDFTYSNRDQVTQIDRFTDTAGTSLKSQTVYGLDDEGKALTITHKNSGGTTVDSFTYTYDLADRIMTETSTLGATKTYTYDRTSQVTADGTTSYSWDANGNRNNAGYTTTTGNRLSTDGTYNFTYDAAGNETKKVKISNDETWVYAYDHNNRMTHAEKRATQNGAAIESIDFKYDIFGNRIERDYDSDGAGAATAVVLKMAYENGNAWADLDNALALTMRRVYTDGLDSLVARIDSGNNEDWYLTDVIGSVRDLVNSSGTLIDHIDYGSFGNITTETQPTVSDRYKYTSREFEKEADIQYNRARYLQYGRWMSQDPAGFGAGDSNLFRYVMNNPIVGLDPSGLSNLISESASGSKEVLYYEHTNWAATAFVCWGAGLFGNPLKEMPIRIGIHDKTTGYVSRYVNGVEYHVAYLKVKSVAEASFGGAPNWNQVFKDNAKVMEPGQKNGVVLSREELGENFHNTTMEARNLAAALGVTVVVAAGAALISYSSFPSNNPSQVGHMFRNAPGHVNPANPQHRAIYVRAFERVGGNPRYLRTDAIAAGQNQMGVTRLPLNEP